MSGSGRLSKTIKKPTQHADMERFAEQWEEAVMPRWESFLVPSLVDSMPLPSVGSMLVAECRTGFAVEQLVRKMGENVRCIAIDPSREMLDIARARRNVRNRRVWWDARSVDQLPYQKDVFDGALCASGILTKDELHHVGSELVRVTKSGAPVGLLVPMAHAFHEFYDLFREATFALDLPELEGVLNGFMDNLFYEEDLQFALAGAGIKDAEIQPMRLDLGFSSGEGFLLDSLIASIFLPHWLKICPDDEVCEAVFLHIGKALDTYFHGLQISGTAHIARVWGRSA